MDQLFLDPEVPQVRYPSKEFFFFWSDPRKSYFIVKLAFWADLDEIVPFRDTFQGGFGSTFQMGFGEMQMSLA